MADDDTRCDAVFCDAIEIAAPEERATFIARACGPDEELRLRIERLVAAHFQAGSFLEAPLDTPPLSMAPAPPAEGLGTSIGPYKLLQQIGEGGMGTVYMAEQARPVRRTVALKVIKPGMDSRQVIARFEAERQALALMDHVNIARVLDAGATDSGRPYFVMELVHGIPITQYCDDNRLTTRQRLELFVPVCQAIQHAHQKGIIHRDVKPSNVLVTLYDGKPVPKVIDFGVAKATQQRLTERTLFTQCGTLVGTLEYMSPEQAETSALGVDTRSDIYSLGVLLYELLTGSTPLGHDRIREAAYAEILRMIKEEEPPRPSTRLSDSGESLASISARRRTEPVRLTRLVRGELDWIVMRSLEKDRNRRYETANGLAADLQHYLNDEPVSACPPSINYRVRKFARRNKGAVTAAGVILLTLIVGILGTTAGLIRAEKARQSEAIQRLVAQANEKKAIEAAVAEKKAKQTAESREAESRAILDFVQNKVFAAAGPKGDLGGLGREVTLRQAIEAALPFVETSFPGQPSIEASLRLTLGNAFYKLGEADKAAEQFQKARRLTIQCLGITHHQTLRSMHGLALSYDDLGRHAEALELGRETLAQQKTTLGAGHPDTLSSMIALAASYSNLGRHTDALKLTEETLALQKAKLGPEHPETLRAMVAHALSYTNLNRNDEAIKLLEGTLSLHKTKLGFDHRITIINMINLAGCYSNLGRTSDALKLTEESLALQKAKLGPDHPFTLKSMSNLAYVYHQLGRHADALGLHDETLALRKFKLGPDHPNTLHTMHLLADEYVDVGRHAEALALREETLALRKFKLGPDHPSTLETMRAVASSLVNAGRHAEAVPIVDECLKRAEGRIVHPRLIGRLMYLRIRHFQKLNDTAGCRATAEMAEKPDHTDAFSLYASACMRAVTAAVLVRDPRTPAADASQLARQQAERAMMWLNKAVAAGERDFQHMKQDADLDALREREDFQRLIADLELRANETATREFAKEAEALSRAIELKPDRWESWHARAWAYFQRQQWEKSVADFSEAIRRDPEVHTNWYHRGHAHLNLAQWDKAAADFSKVVDGWPDEPGGWYGRGSAHAQSNQPDKALADLRQAISKGFRDVKFMTVDPRLDPLRSDNDFKTLLATFQAGNE